MADPQEELKPEELQEAEASYKKLEATAMQLDSREIKPFPGSALLVYQNVKAATETLLRQKEKLSAEVSAEVLGQIQQAPTLARALVFAARRVDTLYIGVPTGVDELLEEARPLRRLLLKSVDACAEVNLVPPERVLAIYKGRGPVDHAQDCLDLATLFREFAKNLANKTPVEDKQIDRCALLGTKLLDLLKPKGTPTSSLLSEELETAIELRDRFYTLVEQRYTRLWKVATQIYDRGEADEVVPPLLSRNLAPRTPDTPEIKAKKEKAKEAQATAKAAEKEVRSAVKAAKKKK